MKYFLESKRLGFRYWLEKDLPLASALWRDPRVMLHMGGAMTAEQVHARLDVERQRQAAIGISYWPIFDLASGEHVGCAGLRPFHDEVGVYELGVHIVHSFWGCRYGEEAARALIDYAFRKLEARQLVAGHGPYNVHSKALIERIGFRFSHLEPWGAQRLLHPFYRMSALDYCPV
jgi:[ribosomal protein S5]-alanine N-acetyltransferase